MLSGVALSRLGLPPNEFYELTPIEFDEAIRDADEREASKIQILVRNQSEMIRWQTWHLLNVHTKKGKSIRDPQQLGKFSWEQKEKVKPMSREQMLSAIYAIAGKKMN